MIPDHLSELLTAYIDGELSNRRRKSVQRLLRRSAEARAMLEQLQEDARALRGLPRERLPEDLSSQVLRKIANRRLQVARRAALAQRPPFPAWAGYAAAASVIITMIGGTYLYFYLAETRKANTDPAAANGEIIPKVQPQPDGKDPVATRPSEEPAQAPPEKSKGPDPVVENQKPPPDPQKDPLTKQSPPLDDLAVIELSLDLTLKDLGQEKAKQKLRSELKKASAYRLELSSHDNARAFGRLKGAFKARGFNLIIDQLAQTRLKNRAVKTDYVLYAENVTADELAELLEQLSGDDRKDSLFGLLRLLPLAAEDHKKISEWLGVDLTKLDPQKREKSTEEVPQSVGGQGATRPDTGKPRPALVLCYIPVRVNPATSKEIKLFLDSRAEKRPGTLRILLVLRHAGGE